MLKVSVPYRGATFLNRIRSPDLFLTSVSVPYRGATFLNCAEQRCTGIYHSRFRPLSGSYISQSDKYSKAVASRTVSVPYRGATFLNSIISTCCKAGYNVSVPYRGATFLNTIPATPCPVWDE